MANTATAEALLSAFDRSPLNRRYWTIFGLLATGSVLDFFDFFIVGYLVAQLGPQWHLTYGQSSLILLAGGLGAIVSALTWGVLSDKFGRKRQLVSGYLICAFGAGAIALVPDGNWQLFAVLRLAVGFGLAAAFGTGGSRDIRAAFRARVGSLAGWQRPVQGSARTRRKAP